MVTEITMGKVKLGVTCDPSITVHREEIQQRVDAEKLKGGTG
jgi:sRNA-binding carbon storage regulator CsrA